MFLDDSVCIYKQIYNCPIDEKYRLTEIKCKYKIEGELIFLKPIDIPEYLQGIAENSTSTYPSIKPSDIETLQINLPPLPEQQAIAEVLGVRTGVAVCLMLKKAREADLRKELGFFEQIYNK